MLVFKLTFKSSINGKVFGSIRTENIQRSFFAFDLAKFIIALTNLNIYAFFVAFIASIFRTTSEKQCDNNNVFHGLFLNKDINI